MQPLYYSKYCQSPSFTLFVITAPTLTEFHYLSQLLYFKDVIICDVRLKAVGFSFILYMHLICRAAVKYRDEKSNCTVDPLHTER